MQIIEILWNEYINLFALETNIDHVQAIGTFSLFAAFPFMFLFNPLLGLCYNQKSIDRLKEIMKQKYQYDFYWGSILRSKWRFRLMYTSLYFGGFWFASKIPFLERIHLKRREKGNSFYHIDTFTHPFIIFLSGINGFIITFFAGIFLICGIISLPTMLTDYFYELF